MISKALRAEELGFVISSVEANYSRLHAASLRAHIAALEADNAALAKVAKAAGSVTEDIVRHGRCADCPYVSQEEAVELLAIIDAPHPGAALLERHEKEQNEVRSALRVAVESTDAGIRIIRETAAALGLPDIRHSLPEEARKALVRARNEGRIEAIAEIRRAKAKAPPGSMAHSLLLLAEEASTAMKEPEQ